MTMSNLLGVISFDVTATSRMLAFVSFRVRIVFFKK